MQTITINGKARKVVGYVEYTYKDALNLFVANGGGKNFGWVVASDARQDTSRKAFSVWENGADWSAAIKFQRLVRAYKDSGKRPKMVRFAFTRDDVYMVNNAGDVIL